MKRGHLATVLIFVVLLIDQASKIYVKTHFEYNEDLKIMGLQWARLHFVENRGMAFGIAFDWPYGKLTLTLFRLLMVTALLLYMRALALVGTHKGLLYSIALIAAGALGNIIDSVFYGALFTESPLEGGVAQFTAFGQGYAGLFHGKVVDMLYFPMYYLDLPKWLGGGNLLFMSIIFNVSDVAIAAGVIGVLGALKMKNEKGKMKN